MHISKDCSMKRIPLISSVLLLFALAFVSCSTTHVMQNNANVDLLEDTSALSAEEKLTFEYTFTEAVKQKLLGNFDNALSLLYQSLEIHPRSGAVMHEISSINELSNNYEVATKYAEKAFAIQPENKWFGLHLAQLYIVDKQYNKSIEVYEKMKYYFPKNMEVAYNLALLYEETQQWEKAIDAYSQFETIVGTNEQSSMAKSRLYNRLGKKRKALKEVENLIEFQPNEVKYYGILAEMYAADGDFKKARQMYDRLFAVDSTSQMGRLSLLEFYKTANQFEAFFKEFHQVLSDTTVLFENKVTVFVSLLSNPHIMNKHYKQIEQCLLFAKEKFPQKADIYTLHADYLVKMKDFSGAVSELQKVVDMGAAKWLVWEQLISLQSFIGKNEDMYSNAQRVVDSFPNKPQAFLYAGMGALFSDDAEQAIVYLKKGNRLVLGEEKELQVNFYSYLGEAYNRIEKHDLSDSYFEKVLNLDGENIFVLNNYSYYLSLRNENLEHALALSGRALELQPEEPTYLDTYAWILYKLGRYTEALEVIEKAVTNGGVKDPDVLEHYGDILNANNKLSEALIYWHLAIKMGSKSDLLQKKIDAGKATTDKSIDIDNLQNNN